MAAPLGILKGAMAGISTEPRPKNSIGAATKEMLKPKIAPSSGEPDSDVGDITKAAKPMAKAIKRPLTGTQAL